MDIYATRRKKSWKIWSFNQLKNCWQLDTIKVKDMQGFIAGRNVIIELAAGRADLSVELARRYTDRAVIAMDIKGDRLYAGAKTSLDEGLDNIRFLRGRIEQLTEAMPLGSVSSLWITFPDPMPKDSQEKHRLTGSKFLALYKQILAPSGKLYLKTDNAELFDWSVLQLKAQKWKVEYITRDLHTEKDLLDAKITTTYERKFLDQGLKTHFLIAHI